MQKGVEIRVISMRSLNLLELW